MVNFHRRIYFFITKALKVTKLANCGFIFTMTKPVDNWGVGELATSQKTVHLLNADFKKNGNFIVTVIVQLQNILY